MFLNESLLAYQYFGVTSMTDYAPGQIVWYSNLGENERRLLYIRQVLPDPIAAGVVGSALEVTVLDTMAEVREVLLYPTISPSRFFNYKEGHQPLNYDLGEVFATNVQPCVIDELVVPRTDALREAVMSGKRLVHLADTLFPQETVNASP